MIKNQIKTIILLGALTALMLWFGSFWGQQGLFVALFPELSDSYKGYIFKGVKYKNYSVLVSYHLASISSNVGNLEKRKVYYNKIQQF